jgi:TetR/AcrR family transcriptional regulator
LSVVVKLGRPRAVKDTHLRCLAAAEAMFADHGFDGTSLRDVAAAVGITSAAVIHHFGTKEKLYGLVLQRLVKSLDEYIVDVDETVVPETVVRMFERFLDWSFDHQHFAQLLLRELIENRVRVSRARRLYLATLIKRYVDYIERGQKLGVFRAFDAELFVFYTLGAITHFSAAAPTIDRMLSGDLDDAISRFRLTLRDNVAMTLGVAGANAVEGKSRRAKANSAKRKPTNSTRG